jgi:signal transduction histidine kinase
MPKVPCMATEIEQVMLNLLKNAAQAMAEKVSGGMHPRITLRLRHDGDTARIEVEDNGPGMDEKHRKRVFEPFFTTKEVGTGTGLGLSVSYFIVTSNHKGRMAVESEPGRGARFIIELPLEQ